MGIKRGSFESVGLGALAQSANPSYHGRASVAAGLGALAEGLKMYADGWNRVGKGLQDWSKTMWQFADYASRSHRLQEQCDELVMQAQENFRNECDERGLTEKDAEYWDLHDEMERMKYRAEHAGLFGIWSSPQPTWKLTDEQMSARSEAHARRDAALGLTEKDEQKRTEFGAFHWFDGEDTEED